MSVKLNSNGDFAENFVTSNDSPNQSEVISDLYDLLQKSELSVQSLSHEFRKAYDVDTDSDSDIARWCNAVPSINLIEPTDSMDSSPNLGRLFFKAVGYSANDYTSYANKYDSEVDIRSLDECGDEGEFIRSQLSSEGIIDDKETVHVAVNSEGKAVVPFAMSKERQEKLDLGFELPTYEESKERLETLLNDYCEVDGETVEDTDKDSDTNNNSGSDEEDYLLSEVNGVGSKLADKIRQHVIENRTTVDWREHIDGDAWHEAPSIITVEEATKRVKALYGEIPEGVYTVAKEEAEAGNTEKAITLIEDFE